MGFLGVISRLRRRTAELRERHRKELQAIGPSQYCVGQMGRVGRDLRNHLEHLLVQAEHLLNLNSLNTKVTKHYIEEGLWYRLVLRRETL